MRSVHLIALACACVLSVHCGVVEDLQESLAQQQALQSDIATALNLPVQVGWHTQNGVLSTVTLMFDGQAADRTISELADAARPIVAKHFDERPEALVISVMLEP